MISMPVELVAGTIRFSPAMPTLSLVMPNAFGMDGPVISASRMAVLWPFAFIFTAIIAVTKDLPTPPFPLTTPITFLTELAGFNGSKKLVCFLGPAGTAFSAGTAVMCTIFAHCFTSKLCYNHIDSIILSFKEIVHEF